MSVRADWGVTDAAPSVVDPFGPAQEPQSPEMLSPPVDLSTPTPVLRERIDELLHREGNLFDCGITCPLKDLPDATCLACPVSRADETREEITREGLLCQIGQEQERVLMLLLAQQHGERRQ